MIIHSRPNQNRWALSGGLVIFSIAFYALLDGFYTQRVSIEILTCFGPLFTYFLVRSGIDLYISFFKSPAWVDLKSNVLIIKMPFQASYSVNVASVEKVTQKKWYDISGFYIIIMFISENKNKLFFDTVRFEQFDEFLRELKKANPACQIDDSLM